MTKNKKGPKQKTAQDIVALRDKLLKLATTDDAKEKIGLACKGMYKCDKLVDQKCLDTILAKLKALESKKGGRARSRSRTKISKKKK